MIYIKVLFCFLYIHIWTYKDRFGVLILAQCCEIIFTVGGWDFVKLFSQSVAGTY